MRLQSSVYCLITLFLCCTPALRSQSSLTHIAAAQYRVEQTARGIERLFIGNVHIHTERLTISCDTAREILSQNLVVLAGNVRILRDSLRITAPLVQYFRQHHLFLAPNGVRVRDTNIQIVARAGRYQRASEHLIFTDSVFVHTDSLSLSAHRIHYWRSSRTFTATGAIKLFLLPDRFLLADSLLGNLDNQCYTAIGNVQSWDLNFRNQDTLFLQADTLRYCRHTLYAAGNVAAAAETFALRTSIFLQDSSNIHLPTPNQIWLDSVYLSARYTHHYSAPDSTATLSLFGNAYVLLPTSAQFPHRWHKLQADTILIDLYTQNPTQIVAIHNAYSCYFLFSESNAPEGVAEHKADTIRITFRHQKPREIYWTNKIYGKILPESLLPLHPELLIPNPPHALRPQRLPLPHIAYTLIHPKSETRVP